MADGGAAGEVTPKELGPSIRKGAQAHGLRAVKGESCPHADQGQEASGPCPLTAHMLIGEREEEG